MKEKLQSVTTDIHNLSSQISDIYKFESRNPEPSVTPTGSVLNHSGVSATSYYARGLGVNFSRCLDLQEEGMGSQERSALGRTHKREFSAASIGESFRMMGYKFQEVLRKLDS